MKSPLRGAGYGPSATLVIGTERLNIENCNGIRERGKQLIAQGTKHLKVDLSGVNFIDSSGFGALVGLRKAIGPEGLVTLVSPTKSVIRFLEITTMNNVFEIEH